MSDPKWRQFLNPVMDKVVVTLACFVSGVILDKLLASGCLTDEQHYDITETLEKSGCRKTSVARRLLLMLKLRPAPSFDRFCSVVREFDLQGELLCLLTSSVQELDSAELFCDDDNSLIIHVDKKLKEKYKHHHQGVVALVRSVIKLTEKKSKKLQVTRSFVPGMVLTTSEKKSRAKRIAVSQKCDLRIYLPNTAKKRFLLQKKMLFRKVCSLFKHENIEILRGSCNVILTLKGMNLVRFICDLHDLQCLMSFIQLDPGVEIEFLSGNFQPAKLADLLWQSSLVVSVAQVFSTTVLAKGANYLDESRLLSSKCRGLYHFLDSVNELLSKFHTTQIALQGLNRCMK